jgi:DNA-directed RNA polymerase specialized sigma24 family protein
MIESRLKACFDRAKELLGIVGEWYNVRGFRNAISSRLACRIIPQGYLERLYKHYHQAIRYIRDLLYAKCGLAVAEEFKGAALFALYDDMEDYQKMLDEIEENSCTGSKYKAPLHRAAKTALRKASGEVVEEHAEQTENKDVARNVVRRNVVRTEKAEKRREEMLNLLRNNQDMTYENLAAIFGCDKLTIYRDIRRLEASGRLRRIGDSFTGHWEIKKVENAHLRKQIEILESFVGHHIGAFYKHYLIAHKTHINAINPNIFEAQIRKTAQETYLKLAI